MNSNNDTRGFAVAKTLLEHASQITEDKHLSESFKRLFFLDSLEHIQGRLYHDRETIYLTDSKDKPSFLYEVSKKLFLEEGKHNRWNLKYRSRPEISLGTIKINPDRLFLVFSVNDALWLSKESVLIIDPSYREDTTKTVPNNLYKLITKLTPQMVSIFNPPNTEWESFRLLFHADLSHQYPHITITSNNFSASELDAPASSVWDIPYRDLTHWNELHSNGLYQTLSAKEKSRLHNESLELEKLEDRYDFDDQEEECSLEDEVTKHLQGTNINDPNLFPEADWLIEDFMEQGLNLLVGDSGSGKTTLALNIAHSVIHGTKLMGKYPCMKTGRVMYCTYDHDALNKSADKISKATGLEWGDNLITKNMNKDFNGYPLDTKYNGNLRPIDVIEGMAIEKEVVLIIIDYLQSASPVPSGYLTQEQKDKIQMMPYERLRDATGATVINIHHSSPKNDNPNPFSQGYGGEGLKLRSTTKMFLRRAATWESTEDQTTIAIKFKYAKDSLFNARQNEDRVFEYVGTVTTQKEKKSEDIILEAINNFEDEFSAQEMRDEIKDIAKIDYSVRTIQKQLKRLIELGRIEVGGSGKKDRRYKQKKRELPDFGEDPVSNNDNIIIRENNRTLLAGERGNE